MSSSILNRDSVRLSLTYPKVARSIVTISEPSPMKVLTEYLLDIPSLAGGSPLEDGVTTLALYESTGWINSDES